MAKTVTRHRTPEERTNAVVEGATAITQGMAMPVKSPNAGKVLELTLNMGDLKSVAVAEIRGKLMQARTAAEDLSRKAASAYAAAEAEMVKAGKKFCESYRHPDIDPLLKIVAEWTGDVATTRLVSPEYRYHSNDEKDEPELDIEKRVVSAKIEVRLRNSSGYYTKIDELGRKIEIPFTVELVLCVQKLETAKQAADSAKRDLNDVNRAIAELPHKGDAIQGALTKAHLAGKLTNTTDILSIIEKAANLLALPESVQTALNQPLLGAGEDD